MNNLDYIHNKIPHYWEETTISEVCEVISGQHIKKDNYNEAGKGMPYLTGPDDFGDYKPSISKWVPEPKAIAKRGDVLITVKGSGVGKVNMLKEEEVAISRQLMALRPENKLLGDFLFYYLRLNFPYFQKLGEGSTVPGINRDNINKTLVPLPPLVEQKNIVSKIEELFSKLNAGTHELEGSKQRLEQYQKTMLKSAMSGELTKEWRSQNKKSLKPAADLLEEMNTGWEMLDRDYLDDYEIYEVPSNWEWAKTSSIGEVILGTTPSTSNEKYYGDAYPFYKPTSLEAGYHTKDAEDGLSEEGLDKARYLPPKSTLVTCIGSTIGKTGFIREAGASNQQINSIVPDDEIIPEFVYFACISPTFQLNIHSEKSATTTPILNKTNFSKLPIPVPPVEEQREIKKRIERITSIVNDVEKTVSSGIIKSNRLRHAILKQAFEGELVPAKSDEEHRKKRSESTELNKKDELQGQATLSEVTKNVK